MSTLERKGEGPLSITASFRTIYVSTVRREERGKRGIRKRRKKTQVRRDGRVERREGRATREDGRRERRGGEGLKEGRRERGERRAESK